MMNRKRMCETDGKNERNSKRQRRMTEFVSCKQKQSYQLCEVIPDCVIGNNECEEVDQGSEPGVPESEIPVLSDDIRDSVTTASEEPDQESEPSLTYKVIPDSLFSISETAESEKSDPESEPSVKCEVTLIERERVDSGSENQVLCDVIPDCVTTESENPDLEIEQSVMFDVIQCVQGQRGS